MILAISTILFLIRKRCGLIGRLQFVALKALNDGQSDIYFNSQLKESRLMLTSTYDALD